MKSLKVIAHLMDYPSPEMRDVRLEMIQCLKSESVFTKPIQEKLIAFVDELCTADLLEAQEAYVATFDRGRSVSLLLFEHVHGESRDRGQAMVNLMTEYEKAGLELDARELPDYLPLFSRVFINSFR
ncbi:MAG: nitrate reductase molybdenum cofactor assembly chaperone [Nitrincola sp.]|nr:nitrate reductase molybdenum cofactor assembly chaperone [Nitrincola sp.]